MTGPTVSPEIIQKMPADVQDLGVEFAHILEAYPGRTISAVNSVIVDPDDGKLTVGAPSIIGTVVAMRFSGGVDDTTYLIRVQVTLDDGQQIGADNRLWIRSGRLEGP